jgi:hypothetical protein
MRGVIPALPRYAFMAWCLVKHRDNFTFYLYFALFMLFSMGDSQRFIIIITIIIILTVLHPVVQVPITLRQI